jgi:hypothetical protein
MSITAQDYADRYRTALETGGLTQGHFHTERDGRHLACALGVIGDDVDGPSKCPAQIMPRWLAQMVPAFFDQQTEENAFAWGLEFTAQLARLNGNVPFSVVHDWHANVVCPVGVEWVEKAKRDTAPHIALQAMHLRALAGEKISADEWRPALKAAAANADAYAAVDVYADAYAYADVGGGVYVGGVYVDVYAYAYAYAYANAADAADAYANAYAKRQEIWNRYAVGMTECLKRVVAP